MDIARGKYWDKGIQLTEGCTPCSPGCDHCWEASRAHWLLPEYTDENGRFNGTVRIFPSRLDVIQDRKKPTVWAIWNDMFHPLVPFEFVDNLVDVAENCPQHTFLLLTKRADRMLEYHNYSDYENTDGSGNLETSSWEWPENIWKGLTVCTQREYDEKMILFIQVPGRKYLSIEPMLEDIDPTPPEYRGTNVNNDDWLQELDAILAGGETGRGARPSHPDWFRNVRNRCWNRTDMGRPWALPFFFKQWGEWIPDDFETVLKSGRTPKRLSVHPVTGETYDYAYPWNAVEMIRVGRKKAGRQLDGKLHDHLPWRKS